HFDCRKDCGKNSRCAKNPACGLAKEAASRFVPYFWLLSTFDFTSTAGVLTVWAIRSDNFLASRPLGSQPAEMARISPPLPIKKFVGMVLVWKTFQLVPLVSTP